MFFFIKWKIILSFLMNENLFCSSWWMKAYFVLRSQKCSTSSLRSQNMFYRGSFFLQNMLYWELASLTQIFFLGISQNQIVNRGIFIWIHEPSLSFSEQFSRPKLQTWRKIEISSNKKTQNHKIQNFQLISKFEEKKE